MAISDRNKHIFIPGERLKEMNHPNFGGLIYVRGKGGCCPIFLNTKIVASATAYGVFYQKWSVVLTVENAKFLWLNNY